MPAPAPVRRRWTRPEVLALIDAAPEAAPRYELVDGELLVTPSPNGPHGLAAAELVIALGNWLRHNAVGRIVGDPFDFELEPDTIVRPDVGVVSTREARRLLTEMPGRELLLAVEFISPSSARFDRGQKRQFYQRHVPEYWIVDLDARLFERWSPDAMGPQVLHDTIDWRPSGASAAFELSLPEFFARVFDEPI